ncbi:hypothetical protein Tco_0298514 [Tanacetum coccineum]
MAVGGCGGDGGGMEMKVVDYGGGVGFRRVAESGSGDRVDRMVRSIFGLRRKSRRKTFPAAGGGGRVMAGGELHNLLDKVVSVGTAPGPNSSDHNVNTITNGDGMPRMRTFRETIFPE